MKLQEKKATAENSTYACLTLQEAEEINIRGQKEKMINCPWNTEEAFSYYLPISDRIVLGLNELALKIRDKELQKFLIAVGTIGKKNVL